MRYLIRNLYTINPYYYLVVHDNKSISWVKYNLASKFESELIAETNRELYTLIDNDKYCVVSEEDALIRDIIE